MLRAVVLVKYSLNCIFSILENGKDISESGGNVGANIKENKRKRLAEMPCANVIDEEFLLLHRVKLKKIYNVADEKREIPLSRITRNHMVPQIGGKNNGVDVRRFLKGMELNGLGELIENSHCSLFRINDKENVNEDCLRLMKKLGLN